MPSTSAQRPCSRQTASHRRHRSDVCATRDAVVIVCGCAAVVLCVAFPDPTAPPYMSPSVVGMSERERAVHNDGIKQPHGGERVHESAVEHNLSALIVEDSAIIAERLREMLGTIDGVELLKVVDTERAALRALEKALVDVVLLDLRLREGDGFGVLRAIAAHTKRPIVIVLSNYSLAEYRRTAHALGAQYFLDKAHEMEGLPAILNEIKRHTWH